MERIFGKSWESVGKGSGLVGKARGKKAGRGGWGKPRKKAGRGGWGKKRKKEGGVGGVGDDVIENEKIKKIKK